MPKNIVTALAVVIALAGCQTDFAVPFSKLPGSPPARIEPDVLAEVLRALPNKRPVEAGYMLPGLYLDYNVIRKIDPGLLQWEENEQVGPINFSYQKNSKSIYTAGGPLEKREATERWLFGLGIRKREFMRGAGGAAEYVIAEYPGLIFADSQQRSGAYSGSFMDLLSGLGAAFEKHEFSRHEVRIRSDSYLAGLYGGGIAKTPDGVTRVHRFLWAAGCDIIDQPDGRRLRLVLENPLWRNRTVDVGKVRHDLFDIMLGMAYSKESFTDDDGSAGICRWSTCLGGFRSIRKKFGDLSYRSVRILWGFNIDWLEKGGE